jgi:flagellar biosynthetic protein FliS
MLAVVDEYLQARVLTASPQRLHLMVVDEARKATARLQAALEADDLDGAHLAASRARDCVNELVAGLRSDQSPELVAQVQEWFLHIQKNLHLADLTQSPAAASEALRLINGYRETWAALPTDASDSRIGQ